MRCAINFYFILFSNDGSNNSILNIICLAGAYLKLVQQRPEGGKQAN